MALSGTITNDTTLKGREYYIEWTAAQNIAGNYSDITCNHYLYNAPRYDLYISGRTNSCWVGGIYDSYTSPAISTGGNSTISLGTTTHRIYHNADGTKSAGISGTFYIQATLAGVYFDSVTASATIELNRIPRGARITDAPNFNDEESPAITYVNDAGAMLTGLQAAITSADGATTYAAYRTIPTAGGTYTFSLTTAEREALRAACVGNSMPVVFRLKSTTTAGTFYNDALRTMAIINAAPVCTITAEDVNAAVRALASKRAIVRNASDIQYSVTAQGAKGATIARVVVSCGDETKETLTGTFYAAHSSNLWCEVTDSRGNTSGTGYNWSELIDYVTPTISGAVGRPTAAGVARLQAQGVCFNGNFAITKPNACAVYWYDSTDGGATYGVAQALTVTRTGNNWEVDQQISGLDYRYPHTIKIEIVDSLNTRAAVLGTVSAIPIFYWNDKIFKHETPVEIMGEQLIDYVIAEGETDGWAWRKYSSGVAECWKNISMPSSTSGTTSLGTGATGIYYNSVLFNYPFEFVTEPVISATAYETGSGAAFAEIGDNHTKTRAQVYMCGTSAAITHGKAFTHIIGRWK